MSDCREYIERIYTDKKINEFIAKIQPAELQDDLRQELAMILLNYDCDKIAKMYREGNLIGFTFATIWKMGTGNKGYFYKTYRKKEYQKAIEYTKYLYSPTSSNTSALAARKRLNNKKQMDANQAHEAIIFEAYIELRSCKKVADYFGIPHPHVFNVVKKCKQELKQEIKNANKD